MRRLALLAVCSVALPLFAEEIDYNFKDPKGVNMVSFHLDSALEPFGGFAYGVEGYLSFDPENPSGLSGHIDVPAKNIVTPNAKMTEVLHGEDWLHVSRYEVVHFEVGKVVSAKKTGEHAWNLKVEGSFTLRGITKPLTTELQLTRVPNGAPERGGAEVGDLLIVRTAFSIARADFNIKPGQALQKVASTIDVKVGITGYGL